MLVLGLLLRRRWTLRSRGTLSTRNTLSTLRTLDLDNLGTLGSWGDRSLGWSLGVLGIPWHDKGLCLVGWEVVHEFLDNPVDLGNELWRQHVC